MIYVQTIVAKYIKAVALERKPLPMQNIYIRILDNKKMISKIAYLSNISISDTLIEQLRLVQKHENFMPMALIGMVANNILQANS